MKTTVKTWGEALDFQMKRWKRTRSAKTAIINSNHISRHVGRSYPLTKMGKTGFWMNLQEELQDEGKSTSTVNRICSNGTHVLKESYLAGLHGTPCPPFKRLKEGKHRLTWFTKDQVEDMAYTAVHVFDRIDLAEAILWSAYTGCRQGELMKLRGRDLDLINNRLWIGGKPEQVTKPRDVRAILLADRIKEIAQRRASNDYLFRDDFETKDRLYYAFKKVRDHLGIPEDHCWHTLRHSFGTWLGEHAAPRQIMEVMGHSSVEVSLRYIKPTQSACDEAIGRL